MTTAELKLEIIRLVLDCEDQAKLEYGKYLFEILTEEDDLPPEVISALICAADDDDLSDAIPHEEALKLFQAHLEELRGSDDVHS